MKNKFLWYTDTHMDKITPWTRYSFLKHIGKEEPTGIILTGDISNGRNTVSDLSDIAEASPCNIYFVLGNHDYHWSSIEKTHDQIRNLCVKRPNLIWMTEAGVVHINDEVAFIGAEGWYDAEKGKAEFLKWTFDWFLVEDFRKLMTMEERIAAWRALADQSAHQLADVLEKAIEQKYKNIYLFTHFPPWKEATRDVGTIMEKFWLPYNTNLRLGRALETVMETHKKKHLTVLAGHTHTECWIHVSRNIECRVNKAKYYESVRNEEHLFI
jgi:predicted phosphohydrolase